MSTKLLCLFVCLFRAPTLALPRGPFHSRSGPDYPHYIPFSTNLPGYICKLLCVSHDFAKVNVEHLSAPLQHDVVIVAITDPQDEGGYAPTRTRLDEIHHRLQVHSRRLIQNDNRNTERSNIRIAFRFNLFVAFFSSVQHVEPFLQRVDSKRPTHTPLLVNLSQRHGIWHNFHQT